VWGEKKNGGKEKYINKSLIIALPCTDFSPLGRERRDDSSIVVKGSV